MSERETVVVDAGTKVDALRITHKKKKKVKKFNQNHDEIGRFSDADGNTTGVGGPGADSKKGGGKKGGGKPGSSATNPIKTSDVNEALRLLSEGKHVELETVAEVATMVKALNKIVQDAVKKGKDAPSYDLCRVSVANTNIFCAQHKDIPRLNMPQLKGDPRPGSKAAGMEKNKWGEVDIADAYLENLKSRGVEISPEEVKASSLKASQRELVGKKVAEMVTDAQRPKGDPKRFDPSAGTIYISRDGYIIDGHHRWATVVALDAADGTLGDEVMNVVRVDMAIAEVLKDASLFAEDIGIPSKGTAYKKRE